MTNILLLILVWPYVGPTGIPTCKYIVYEIDLGLTKKHQFEIFWLLITQNFECSINVVICSCY